MSEINVLPPPRGIYTPSPTFFNNDFSLDLDSQSKHSILLKNSGITGILACGSMGEGNNFNFFLFLC
jgi:dihydrodipicolinate synthase/N-acetylneuraminate lyase